jgi:LmbE family N-acetylglucosaminyl deacetylase
MSTIQHIYLSPHYDDAVLSCGGQIAHRVAAGETVIVATVFGGAPQPERLSPFAAAIHARPGGGEDLVALRQNEDVQALEVLGAISRQGDYLDCIYRQDEGHTRWYYDNEEALFGPVAPAERSLAYELAQVFAALAPKPDQCILYAPLAVGNHVDHQIVNKAAMSLQQAGYTVYFYEDYPYIVRDPAGLDTALKRAGQAYWRSQLVVFDETAMARKVEAIRAYASQIGVLFGADSDIKPAIASYTRKLAGSTTYGERLWQFSAQAPQSADAAPAHRSAQGDDAPALPAPKPPSPWQALRAWLQSLRRRT